jgi:predicted amidophosphoribosyltransferase
MKPKRPTCCPICLRIYDSKPALSRYDNKTHICPDCGIVEASHNAIIYSCLELGSSFADYARRMYAIGYRNQAVRDIIKAARQARK